MNLFVLIGEVAVVAFVAVLCYQVYVVRKRRGDVHAVLLAVARFSPQGGTARQIEVEAERSLGCSLGMGRIWVILAGLERDGRIAPSWGEPRRPGGPRPVFYNTIVTTEAGPTGSLPATRRED